MAQVINTNISSLNAQRNLNTSQSSLATSLQRLSTGLRINSAKDDAAGLAISERFTTQIRGLNQAVRNANDGISFAQTAEGALGTVGDALQRIRELSVQAINDTNSSADRAAINNEVAQLISEVNRISGATQFNGQNILDGSLSELTFQVGSNQNQTINVSGVDGRTSQLGAASDEGTAIDISTPIAAAGDLTDLVINGVTVDLSAAASINDAVNTINESFADTGVQALRSSTTVSPALTYASGSAADNVITINSVDIAIGASATQTEVVTALNDRSAQTGVTAESVGGTVILTSSSGADIDVVETGTDDILGGDQAYAAGIILAAGVGESITVAGTDAAALGLDAIVAVDSTLAGVDTLTGSNANDALLTLDFALQQVNGLRAELGAVQTRFESTIANLSITSENLSAARSRILDADFAAETSNLTRAQILQQAGTAMLAQANAIPQNVLSLLG
mgnify:CR=1 FL=1